MSVDEVTVSLSRLALAKAIKTPDAGETEAEPWSKSIIFHQAHIDAQMRNSIQNPQSLQQQNRRKQPSKRPHQQQQQQQRYPQQRPGAPPMNRARSDESQRIYQQKVLQQQQQQHQHQHQQQPIKLPNIVRPSSASSGSNGRSSLSSGKLANNTTGKPTRRFVPSDDEEEEEEDSDDDDDESEEEKEVQVMKNVSSKTAPVLPPIPMTSMTPISQSKGKGKARIPQPSDDEDEDEQEDDESVEEEVQEDQQLYARRMSTLRQLERGPSAHRRTRSTGDVKNQMITPETTTNAPPGNMGSIEHWRMTVMEADDINTAATPPSSESFIAPLNDEEEDESDELIEETIVRAPNQPVPDNNNNNNTGRNRRSTIGELDMYYFQQQQQQQQMAYNMQLQQAMQMQQAQQYAQIQQYQAMQQQQYHNMSTIDNNTRKNNNRKSVSAMDLMIQLEQEKAASRKTYKKKLPDPSKASLGDGLLGRVPDPGQHNLNFQQQVHQQQMKANRKQMSRASKSDYAIQQQQQQQQQRTSRPPSSMMMYDNNKMMRSQMIRSESSPIPQISMSTPIHNPQYMVPPQMMLQPHQQQQQMMMPPNMTPSRSSQYISKPSNNSNRLSTFSGYNF